MGRVTGVDRATIEELCYAGIVPVIPSMCITEEGEKLNVNADTAATAVAQALQAEKLVYLSDVNGVRRDKNDPESLIHSLTADQARELIASGAIEAGMIPKVQACLETLNAGSAKSTSSTAACGIRCCWKSIPARAWARKSSRTANLESGATRHVSDALSSAGNDQALRSLRDSATTAAFPSPWCAAKAPGCGTAKGTAISICFPAGAATCWAIARRRWSRPCATSWAN